MKHIWVALFSLALLVACAEEPPVPDPEEPAADELPEEQEPAQEAMTDSELLHNWLDEQYEEYLAFSPMQLTRMGEKKYYDQLDDFSVSGLQERVNWLEDSVETMSEEFDYAALDHEAQLSYDLWHFQLERLQQQLRYVDYPYVFDQMRAPHNRLPQFMINSHDVDSYDDMRAYISRLEAFETALGDLLQRAEQQANNDIRPPRFAFEQIARQAENMITGQPFGNGEDSPLWADAQEKIAALEEAGEVDSEQAEALRNDARAALTDAVEPIYQELLTWVASEQEYAAENPTGVSKYEGGERFYEHQLWNHTTTDMTAEEIHQLGLAEVERIQIEMIELMREVGFDGELQDFFDYIRTDEQFRYPDTDAGREAYMADTRDFLASMEERLPEYFGLMPQAELEVRRVEAFREQDGAPPHYYPSTPDGTRPGIYYLHLSDMDSLSKADMESIAYHEGVPGHHMQIAIQQELTTLPDFRTQERYTVYTEGWALYAEKLAKEMGAFEDPYSDFGRLNAEIWRAIRLVVDTGLHAMDWTEDEAVEYMLENGALSESVARAEVQRYLVMPGQATAYKVGMMRIEELRDMAENELAEMFEIRAFHDVILGGGALPLPMLQARVENWIETVQTGLGGMQDDAEPEVDEAVEEEVEEETHDPREIDPETEGNTP